MKSLQTLTAESNERHWKINDITDELKTIQYDFVSLNQRLALVEASNAKIENSVKECKTTARETEGELGEIQQCTEEARDTLERVEGFIHPCCGDGWRRVVYFDMTDPEETCPTVWEEIEASGGRRLCKRPAGTNPGTCPTATLADTIEKPYTEVCGRVRGYQKGLPRAFQSYISSLIGTPIGFDSAFVDGLIVQRNDPTDGLPPEHIWTFAAGAIEETGNTHPNIEAASHCPCIEGEVDFENMRGELPDFINGRYFCASGLPGTGGAPPNAATLTDFLVEDPLWDGKGCPENSDCCNYGTPPHFTTVLDEANTFNIDARLCLGVPESQADIGIEMIEIFVR